jgi:hypothetical protein
VKKCLICAKLGNGVLFKMLANHNVLKPYTKLHPRFKMQVEQGISKFKRE